MYAEFARHMHFVPVMARERFAKLKTERDRWEIEATVLNAEKS